MARMTGAEFAEKWGRRLTSDLDAVRKGIEAVSEAPGKLAAAKKSKWVARLSDPAVQAKWERNIGSVSLEDWKRAASDLGVGRIPGGVANALDRMARFGEQLLAYQQSNLSKIQSMPDITTSDAKARMDAWFDIMAKFKAGR